MGHPICIEFTWLSGRHIAKGSYFSVADFALQMVYVSL
jgi:hypothetical protein